MAQILGNKSWLWRHSTKYATMCRARGLMNAAENISCVFEIWETFSSPSSLLSTFRACWAARAIVKDHPPLDHSAALKLQVRCHQCIPLKQGSCDSVLTEHSPDTHHTSSMTEAQTWQGTLFIVSGDHLLQQRNGSNKPSTRQVFKNFLKEPR